jgi:hypothetical protein
VWHFAQEKKMSQLQNEIAGGLGELTQPSPRMRSLYAIGIRKPGGGGPNVTWTILTNGDLVLQDAREARYTALIAKAEVPVIAVPRETVAPSRSKIDTVRNLQYRKQIQAFLSENSPGTNEEQPNIYKIIRFSTGKTGLERGTTVKPADIMAKTWPLYPGHGIMAFETRKYSYLLTEEYELHEIFDAIQKWVSDVMTTTKPVQTQWRAVGLGMVEMGESPKVTSKPGERSRYSERYEIEMGFPMQKHQIRDMAWYYFGLELLGQVLQKIVTIQGYSDEDYMALAWQLLFQRSGTGTNSVPSEWPLNMDDIYAQVLDRIGDVSNEAFTFRWDTPNEMLEYVIFCVISAYVQARFKAETMPVEFHIVVGDRLTAVEQLRRIWHVDYDAFGSDTTPFMVPSRTYPGMDYGFPMMVRHGVTNMWDRIAPISGDEFSKVTIEHNEINSSALEPLDPKQMHIEYIATANDARKWTITYRRARAVIFRFPITGWHNRNIGVKGRQLDFLMANLSAAGSHYKRGIIVDPTFGILDNPGFVSVHKNIAGLTGDLLIKKDTNSEPPDKQMQPPGAAATIVAEESKTNVSQIRPEPSPQPTPPTQTDADRIPGTVTKPGETDQHLEVPENHEEPEPAESTESKEA